MQVVDRRHGGAAQLPGPRAMRLHHRYDPGGGGAPPISPCHLPRRHPHSAAQHQWRRAAVLGLPHRVIPRPRPQRRGACAAVHAVAAAARMLLLPPRLYAQHCAFAQLMMFHCRSAASQTPALPATSSASARPPRSAGTCRMRCWLRCCRWSGSARRATRLCAAGPTACPAAPSPLFRPSSTLPPAPRDQSMAARCCLLPVYHSALWATTPCPPRPDFILSSSHRICPADAFRQHMLCPLHVLLLPSCIQRSTHQFSTCHS